MATLFSRIVALVRRNPLQTTLFVGGVAAVSYYAYRRLSSTSKTNEGDAFAAKGDFPRAIQCYYEALGHTHAVWGPHHPYTADALSRLGVACSNGENYDSAAISHNQAYNIRRECYGDMHPDSATSLSNLGVALSSLGVFDHAIRYHEAALGIRLNLYGERHYDVAASNGNLGIAHTNRNDASQGDMQKAISYYRKALQIFTELHGPSHSDAVAIRDILRLLGE